MQRVLPRRLPNVAQDQSNESIAEWQQQLDHASIKDIIAKYTESALGRGPAHIAACNPVHDAEARLARWLLQTLLNLTGSSQ
jgi:hypothetical protein